MYVCIHAENVYMQCYIYLYIHIHIHPYILCAHTNTRMGSLHLTFIQIFVWQQISIIVWNVGSSTSFPDHPGQRSIWPHPKSSLPLYSLLFLDLIIIWNSLIYVLILFYVYCYSYHTVVNLFPLKCTVLKTGILFLNDYIDIKQTLSGME